MKKTPPFLNMYQLITKKKLRQPLAEGLQLFRRRQSLIEPIGVLAVFKTSSYEHICVGDTF